MQIQKLAHGYRGHVPVSRSSIEQCPAQRVNQRILQHRYTDRNNLLKILLITGKVAQVACAQLLNTDQQKWMAVRNNRM